MKLAFAAIIGLLTLNAFAQDLAVSHAQICAGVKEQCQVIFKVDSQPAQGRCVGKLRNTTNCTVSYIQKDSTIIQVKCTDQLTQVKDEMVLASGQSYKVSALIKKADKKEVLVNDPSLYTYLEGKSVTLFLSKTNGATVGSVVLKEKGIPTQLTNVSCF